MLFKYGEDSDEYKEAYENYKNFTEKMYDNVEKAVNEASEPGRKKILDAYNAVFGNLFKNYDFGSVLDGDSKLIAEMFAKNLLKPGYLSEPGSEKNFIVSYIGSLLNLDQADENILHSLVDANILTLHDILGSSTEDVYKTLLSAFISNGGSAESPVLARIRAALGLDENGRSVIQEAVEGITGPINDVVYEGPADAINNFFGTAGEAAQGAGQAITDAGLTMTDFGTTTANVSGQVTTATGGMATEVTGDFDKMTRAAQLYNQQLANTLMLQTGAFLPADNLSRLHGMTPRVNVRMKADGGFVSTGDMFIAGEAGPEVVGRIGNRTAVANSDQIVSGIAGGVAAGQEEQNALLRQQNEYLRRLLAKDSTVRVEPSAAWGKFNQRSEEMRLVNAGV